MALHQRKPCKLGQPTFYVVMQCAQPGTLLVQSLREAEGVSMTAAHAENKSALGQSSSGTDKADEALGWQLLWHEAHNSRGQAWLMPKEWED